MSTFEEAKTPASSLVFWKKPDDNKSTWPHRGIRLAGMALPLLQRKFTPFWAGLLLGLIWALWHIPAFLMGGTPQSNWDFFPFFAGVVALSVVLTPLFNASRGSLLIAVIYHFQMMNPIWPDAQPWDSLLIIIAAGIVVWLNRGNMFQRGGAVTDVLMPSKTTARSA